MTVLDNAAARPATAPGVAAGRTAVLRDGSMVWIRQVQAADAPLPRSCPDQLGKEPGELAHPGFGIGLRVYAERVVEEVNIHPLRVASRCACAG